MTTNIYLDNRAVKNGEPAPLKIGITKNGNTAYLPLGIKVTRDQWDKAKSKIKDHPNKNFLNSFIQAQKQKVDSMLLELTSSGELARKTAVQIKNIIAERLSPSHTDDSLFLVRFNQYASTRTKQRTRELYEQTLKMMIAFEPKLSTFSFENITKDWLTKFDRFLSEREPSQNSRSIHFRNIRAVFNDARDNDITEYYPFRKFMVNPVDTAKRAMSVERLRELFNYQVLPHEQKYIDLFKLFFYLIGINAVDLCNLTSVNNGRIEYQRSKTSRLYNIKVEPEAQEIIDKYRGTERLISITEKYHTPHTFVSSFNRALKHIGPRDYVTKGGKTFIQYHPAFPGLSSYVARHTWATIAYELDIPNETIAAALGHSTGNKTTAIYIKNNQRKIDEANRKVIDYVLQL